MASNGEVAELQPAEYPSFYKRGQVPTVLSNAITTGKALSGASVLVWPFGATGGTWWRNSGSVEEDPFLELFWVVTTSFHPSSLVIISHSETKVTSHSMSLTGTGMC